MAMSFLATGNDVAVCDIKRGKKCRRSVPFIAMRDTFDVSDAQRQHRLCSLKGLDLALFVNAEYHRIGRRVEVQPDDIAHFFNEERVGGELEPLLSMRLYPKGL